MQKCIKMHHTICKIVSNTNFSIKVLLDFSALFKVKSSAGSRLPERVECKISN